MLNTLDKHLGEQLIYSVRFFLASPLSGILVDGRRLCSKIGHNEECTYGSLP